MPTQHHKNPRTTAPAAVLSSEDWTSTSSRGRRGSSMGTGGPRSCDLVIADEVSHMRQHPAVGSAMLAHFSLFREVAQYVRGHHERWDGQGYPSGIRGRAIPVEARLLAVADAYDAMTSPRPYRHALSPEHALAEIGRCAGSQFDPQVAALFLELWSAQADPWPAAVAS